MSREVRTAAEEWKAGWTLVLAAAAGFSFNSVITTSMGVFMEPLAAAFGWSRTLVSSGLPLASLSGLILSPIVGRYVDRKGARRIALAGLTALIFSVSGFSQLTGSMVQWFGLWLAYAVISVAVSATVWSAAVTGMFDAGRGLALGFTLAGTAVAQAVTPPLCSWLIITFGWRTAYVWMGFGWGGLALLLCLLFFFDAHERQRAVPKSGRKVPAMPDELPGLTIAEAWRDPGLWRIAISTFLIMVLTIGLLIHQVPILIASGVDPQRAAWLAGLGGVASIVGKLVTGVLTDRFRANWVGGLTLGATALAFVLLLDGIHTPVLIVIAMIINGYSAGTKMQICSYLTSQYGGLRNFGMIYGFMNSLIALGAAMGPLVAGVVYDMTGSYASFLIAGTAGCLFCGFLLLTLPHYPDWKAQQGAEVFA